MWRHHTFKVMLVGDAGVGKTEIVKKLLEEKGKYSRRRGEGISLNHLAIDLSVISENDVTLHMSIWDASGKTDDRKAIKVYFPATHVCLVVFDLSQPGQFYKIDGWLSEFRKNRIPTTKPI